MNHHIADSKWRQMMGNAKQYWSNLTDEDVRRAELGEESLLGLLQDKFGRSRQEAEKQIDEFVKKYH